MQRRPTHHLTREIYMGLDITAYRGLTKVECIYNAEGMPLHPETREELVDGIDYHVCVYINPDFPGRASDLEHRAIYKSTEHMGFRAGGYGGYNGWREELAKLAGYPASEQTQYGASRMRHDQAAWDATSGPFWELICFSDCEGAIGTAVSAKLAKDFADHQSKADAHHNDVFRERYALWRSAFELAADGGAVDFH
jgi:hypothetical protein